MLIPGCPGLVGIQKTFRTENPKYSKRRKELPLNPRTQFSSGGNFAEDAAVVPADDFGNFVRGKALTEHLAHYAAEKSACHVRAVSC